MTVLTMSEIITVKSPLTKGANEVTQSEVLGTNIINVTLCDGTLITNLDQFSDDFDDEITED